MQEILDIEILIVIISFIAGGYLIGYITEKIILSRLKNFAKKTKWEGDEVVISALKGMPEIWFVLLGFYLGLFNMPLSQNVYIIFQRVILVVVISTATLVLAKIAVGFVDVYTKKTVGILPSSSIFTNLTKLIIFAIGALVILQTFGISVMPIITAMGIGGLAIALALQDTLSNLFSGLNILATKQIKPGDYVKLDSGEEGYVEDITWRNTIIKMLSNNMIIIPNSKLASSIVTNYFLYEKEISVLIPVGVSYDSDLEKVEKITLKVAEDILKKVKGGIPAFKPFIRYNAFSDSSIDFNVIFRVKEFADQYVIRHEFIKKLHKRYKKEGIEIPFPIRTVHLDKE